MPARNGTQTLAEYLDAKDAPIDRIRPIIKDSRLYVIVRSISLGRTKRVMSFFGVSDGHLIDISREVADILDYDCANGLVTIRQMDGYRSEPEIAQSIADVLASWLSPNVVITAVVL